MFTLRGAAYAVRVRGLNGVRTSAVISPASLTRRLVSGVVDWDLPNNMSSIVQTEGDSSPWLQGLFLVYAAAGPDSISHVPELAAQCWASFWTTFPDPGCDAGGQIQIALHRGRWDITFIETNPRRVTKRLPIPAELRYLDVGSLLLEIAYRQAPHYPLPDV